MLGEQVQNNLKQAKIYATLRYIQLCHCVEYCTSDKGLGDLSFQKWDRKSIAKDGFHAKHGGCS